jgi:hypothetical protein
MIKKGSPGENVLKRSFTWWRLAGSAVSLVALGFIICRLGQMLLANCMDAICAAAYLDRWTKLVYALWTVSVPLYFFAEWVLGIDWAVAKQPEKKPALDYVKGCQDQARTVWAGFAAALAVLLLKFG